MHARAQLIAFGRYPAFAVPTLLFPTLFFLVFGLQNTHASHQVIAGSFAAYAALTVVFFLFGVGIAGERDEPWEAYLRVLPVLVRVRLAGRVLAGLAFAAGAVGILLLVVVASGYARFGALAWLRLVLALLGGGVALSFLGLALGYWVPAKGALPIANVLYLLFSYAGGLWTGPHGLPHVVSVVAPALPTRQWGDVIWPAVLGRPWHAQHWLALLGFACAFAALAAWGYRRDEGREFR